MNGATDRPDPPTVHRLSVLIGAQVKEIEENNELKLTLPAPSFAVAECRKEGTGKRRPM